MQKRIGIGNPADTIKYAYDADSNRGTETNFGNGSLEYKYDATGNRP